MSKTSRDDSWERKYNDLLQEYDALVAAHEDITAFLAARNEEWKQRAMKTARNSADAEIALEHQRLAIIFEGVSRQYAENEVLDADKLNPQIIFHQLAEWMKDGAGMDPVTSAEAAVESVKASPTPRLKLVKPELRPCPHCEGGADSEGWQCMRCRGTGHA